MERKQLAIQLVKDYGFSVRQACNAVNLHRSMYYYNYKLNDDKQIKTLLKGLVEKYPTYGFWKFFHMLKNQGYPWNHKRVYRIYTQLELNIRKKVKKRLPDRIQQPIETPKKINQIWSIDFMSDSLHNGQRLSLIHI